MRKIFIPTPRNLKRRDELMMKLGARRMKDRLVDLVESRMENGIFEAEAAFSQGHPDTGNYLSGAVAACTAIIGSIRKNEF
jgi:hypothetical protein